MSLLSSGILLRGCLNLPAHLSTSALESGKSLDQETKRCVCPSSLLVAAHGSWVADPSLGNGVFVSRSMFSSMAGLFPSK